MTGGDGNVRLSGIDSLATAKIDNVVNVTFAGGHRYSLDINGFGGGTFGPNRLPEGSGYIAFPTSTEELQLENTQSFNTVGRLGDNAGLCFFALGPLATSAIGTGNFSNGGVDGVAQIGGAFSRLRESRVLAWNANGTSEDLRVELATSSPVFGGAAAGARNVLGFINIRRTSTETTVTVEGGSAQTSAARCISFGQFYGVGCTFSVTFANGDRVFGAVGADARLI